VRITGGGDSPADSTTTTEQKPPEPAVNVGATLFGVAPTTSASTPANPFSMPAETPANVAFSPRQNPFAAASSLAAKPAQTPASSLPESFAAKVRISDAGSASSSAPPRPYEPWPEPARFPKPYTMLHLDAEYETLSAPDAPQNPSSAANIEQGEGSGGDREDKVLFESSMDKTFQKFADRMAQNPEQVLRYEFGGAPLLYSTTDAVGRLLSRAGRGSSPKPNYSSESTMPRCTNCGAPRVFEVQMTPHAITALEEDEMSLDGMDWGTVILGVCGRDCAPKGASEGEVGYLEEWIGVQWEESEARTT
jgi:pre-rRNA-processing protein TSR4